MLRSCLRRKVSKRSLYANSMANAPRPPSGNHCLCRRTHVRLQPASCLRSKTQHTICDGLNRGGTEIFEDKTTAYSQRTFNRRTLTPLHTGVLLLQQLHRKVGPDWIWQRLYGYFDLPAITDLQAWAVGCSPVQVRLRHMLSARKVSSPRRLRLAGLPNSRTLVQFCRIKMRRGLTLGRRIHARCVYRRCRKLYTQPRLPILTGAVQFL